MTDPVWWYVTRASGLVAYGLLGLTVVLGVAQSSATPDRGRAPGDWLHDLHRFTGGLALVFTGFHLGGLVLDDEVEFGALELLVPLTSTYRPVAVAWGVLSLYVMAAVQFTALGRRRLPGRLWRRIHYASFPLFALATVHTLTAGTDNRHPGVLLLVGATTALALALTAVRVLLPRRRRRTVGGTTTPRW